MSHLTESVLDEERKTTYTFSATYGFLRELGSRKLPPAYLYNSFLNQTYTIEELKTCLRCSMIEVDGKKVDFNTAEKHAEEIIERFGVIEAVTLAHEMLSRIMIGDLKKSNTTRQAKMKNLMEVMFPNLASQNFMRAGFFWVGTCLVSGLLGGMISKLF